MSLLCPGAAGHEPVRARAVRRHSRDRGVPQEHTQDPGGGPDPLLPLQDQGGQVRQARVQVEAVQVISFFCTYVLKLFG